MLRAAQSFVGSHNFTNFARVQDKNPWRNILAIGIFEENGFTHLEVKMRFSLAPGHGAWRRRSPWLKNTGTQRRIRSQISLNPEPNGRSEPAPPEGLVLWDTDCGFRLVGDAFWRTERRIYGSSHQAPRSYEKCLPPFEKTMSLNFRY